MTFSFPKVSLEQVRHFMVDHVGEIKFPDQISTKEEYECMKKTIDMYYEKYISAMPIFRFTDAALDEILRGSWIEQDGGVLFENSEHGVHSIAPCTFYWNIPNYKWGRATKMGFNCMIRHGKIDGYINIFMWDDDKFGYAISGVAKGGQLCGYCKVTVSDANEAHTCYEGLFQHGQFLTGTVAKGKGDTPLEVQEASTEKFDIQLPYFVFDLSKMVMTKSVYSNKNGMFVSRGPSCCADDM
jgi:hypothetical protein